MKTWFTLDFFSSLPMQDVMLVLSLIGLGQSGSAPNFQPAKLLKFGKIAKVFKVFKVGPLLQSLGENSEVGRAVLMTQGWGGWVLVSEYFERLVLGCIEAQFCN